MLCCSSKEKEAVRHVYIGMYPKLPVFSYKYIIEKYHPSPYLRGFFGVFSEFWLAHKDFLPDVFEIQTLYDLIDNKWKEYYKFMGIDSLDYRLQLITGEDNHINDQKYELSINNFWQEQTSRSISS